MQTVYLCPRWWDTEWSDTGTRDIPFSLPLPTDPRAVRVAGGVIRNVASRATLAELAQGSGASSRTIERLFLDETGLTFGRWVQRAKALHALELLGSGVSVTSAGLSVGYDSTSAFIAIFKKVTGSTARAAKGFTSGGTMPVVSLCVRSMDIRSLSRPRSSCAANG